MIRDEDGALTGYVYIDLNTNDYGGFVTHASDLLKQKLRVRVLAVISDDQEEKVRTKSCSR
jgi:hypothetical protein